MQISKIVWTDYRKKHIARHNIKTEEVEEVLFYDPFVLKSKEKRYIALGQTINGRYLFIVIGKRNKGEVEVITARDMDAKEKRFFRKIKGG